MSCGTFLNNKIKKALKEKAHIYGFKKLTSNAKISETPNTTPNEEYSMSNCDVSLGISKLKPKTNTYCSHLVKTAFHREFKIIAHLDTCLRYGAIILNTCLWLLVSMKLFTLAFAVSEFQLNANAYTVNSECNRNKAVNEV